MRWSVRAADEVRRRTAHSEGVLLVAFLAGARIPDGITNVPDAGTPAGKLFVSDESGEVTTVAPSV